MKRRTFLQLAALAAAQASAMAHAQVMPRAFVAAHRGGALLWPENSMTAYRNALALKVDLLETDIHLTKDGDTVVVHDPTLDRTTTATGPVSARTRAELGSVRLKGLDGGPTADAIPTLGELLDLVAPSPAGLLLEIKVDADRRRYAGIEEKALAQVKARTLLDRTPFMGFQRDTVRRVRELEPSAQTVLLVGKAFVDRQGATAAEIVRWTTESGAKTLGIQHTALDVRVRDAARAAGVAIAAWTVNEEPDVRRVIELGVDVVISDRPDLALKLARR